MALWSLFGWGVFQESGLAAYGEVCSASLRELCNILGSAGAADVAQVVCRFVLVTCGKLSAWLVRVLYSPPPIPVGFRLFRPELLEFLESGGLFLYVVFPM